MTERRFQDIWKEQCEAACSVREAVKLPLAPLLR